MNEPTELLPCPFCSGVAHIADDLITFYGECGTCGATSDYSSYKAGAVANWNRRTPAPQPTQAQAEKCAVCGDGNARLVVMRSCDVCGSDYAGQSESEVNVALERARKAAQAQAVPPAGESCGYEACDCRNYCKAKEAGNAE